MKLDFFKMHAQGNDYIYFDLINKELPKIDLQKLAIKVSERHYGIGSDGIVLILNSENHSGKMRMFNADGSEGSMCGSALRCVCYYLSEKFNENELTIETKSGIKTGFVKDRNTRSVMIDLGIPKFIQEDALVINGLKGYLIDIGNPHFVTQLKSLSENIAKYQGPIIDNPAFFVGGVNVEFVNIINKNQIELKVWERGSGATLACSTGAGAAVYFGLKKKKLKSPVLVQMPGGEVTVEFNNEHIFLTGEVSYIFNGSIEL
ncbi:MAG: diaminopimelate epimerase [Candidatus Cloacimonetes bacterium]|nr:diaminopimelate epimerase [Candidatus Cloacimonadota bacterium]